MSPGHLVHCPNARLGLQSLVGVHTRIHQSMHKEVEHKINVYLSLHSSLSLKSTHKIMKIVTNTYQGHTLCRRWPSATHINLCRSLHSLGVGTAAPTLQTSKPRH